MVLLAMTPAVAQALQYLQQIDMDLEDEKRPGDTALRDAKVGQPISHEQIIQLSAKLKHMERELKLQNVPSHSLDRLLKGSRVFIEPKKPKVEPVWSFKLAYFHSLMPWSPLNTKL